MLFLCHRQLSYGGSFPLGVPCVHLLPEVPVVLSLVLRKAHCGVWRVYREDGTGVPGEPAQLQAWPLGPSGGRAHLARG